MGVAAGDGEPPYAVEEFGYPGAARILQERGIALRKGDGHIVLTDCTAPHDITVKSRTGQKDFCFAVKGRQGYVTMELADAYGVVTQDHPVRAKITDGVKDVTIDAPKNEYTPFGEAGDSGKRSVLLELRVAG